MQRKKRQLGIFCLIFLMVLFTGAGMLTLADEIATDEPPASQPEPEPSTGDTSEYVPIETPAASNPEDPAQTITPASSNISEPTPSAITEPTPTPVNEPNITPTPSSSYVQESTPTPYVSRDNDDDDDNNNTAGTASTPKSTSTPTPKPSASPQAGTIERPKVTLNPTDESTSETKESDYVEFAKVNLRQNALAANMFYGGVALIALGVIGLVVLVVLFIKNRRYARNANEGIFEEIEEAEIRGYYPEPVYEYEDVNADAVYNDDPYAQYANTGDLIMPESTNIYTGEFEPISSYDNEIQADSLPFEHYQEHEQSPAYEPEPPVPQQAPSSAPKTVKPPQKPGYTTEEILREVLNAEKDGHAY